MGTNSRALFSPILELQIRSARPYTVKVSSPDRLADDPDRWRRLFNQFGHVSYVTVARGNGALLRAMAERRRVGRMLEGSTANVSEVRGLVFMTVYLTMVYVLLWKPLHV